MSKLKEISATLLDSRQSAGHDDTGCVLRSKLLTLVLTCYQIVRNVSSAVVGAGEGVGEVL